MDPPNIAIPEGGDNRRKISGSSPKIVESDRSTVAPIETLVDVSGSADNFLALENQEDMNEKGTTDGMDWYALGQDKVQYQLNDADVLDIRPVNILSCYWKPNNGKLMLRITGLDGQREYMMKAEDMRVDHPGDLLFSF